ncbi:MULTISPECIES: hypothetical protein [unclassified Pantoea]|uniref:hypothetical protein n=1 Tax=unclassified Pantoea TaxID=2630326 RepID=UPI002118E0A7|nr:MULTISPECIES: hypothetical protein [unclassified Pantoea]
MVKTVSHQFRSLPDAGWRYLMHFATLKSIVVAPLYQKITMRTLGSLNAARSMHLIPQPTVAIIAMADQWMHALTAVLLTFISSLLLWQDLAARRKSKEFVNI